MNTPTILCITALIAGSSIVSAAERDVQFLNIHSQAKILTLYNSSSTEPVALDGWRFCTQNSTQVRQYTNPSALNGVTIEPWTSIRIHLNNDADPNDPTEFNASDLGDFAELELEAFGISLYFPNAQGTVPFNDGNFIADHLQWSLGGIDNTTADERSDEAEAGGVWVDQSEWISVRYDTHTIELNDSTFAELHSPADYNVFNSCLVDFDGNGLLDFFDISTFLNAFIAQDPIVDFVPDGLFDFFDISSFLSQFSSGCP